MQYELQVEVTELDIQRDRKSDFTLPRVQKFWLQKIADNQFFAVIVTPPCSTFSRAPWANDKGPVPLRSRRFPRGFPWNARQRRCKADFGTILADFSYEAMRRQFRSPIRIGVMEQPEDLGTTPYQRVPGHSPASMWQFHAFEAILAMEQVQTVAFSQMDFGTTSPKPTRFLMRLFVPLHPGMRLGKPRFDSHGYYVGPLERRVGTSLIGTKDGKFKTAASAAWPPSLCQWVAQAVIASFQRIRDDVGGSKPQASKSPLPKAKRQRVEAEEDPVDPMAPPVAGGEGPPRCCSWKGEKVPFHDGGGLLSPGRWSRDRRSFPDARCWSELRAKVLALADVRLGGLAEVEREAFRMARGGESFSLVRDEAFLSDVRLALKQHLSLGADCLVKAEGQPFFLRMIAGVLEKANDPDHEFLRRAEVGLPVGILESLPRTRAVFERQVKWPLEGEDFDDWVFQKDNYTSAGEHSVHLKDHLEAEVREGLMEKFPEAVFEKEFGEHRAVAALAVLVEDEITGKKRVIHDGTHGVKVNQRIKCQDKVRMPGPREKRRLLEEFSDERQVVLSLVGDFAKAHRRFKYQKAERGFLACKADSSSDVVYVNSVGTFGVASTPYWWARISAALMRFTYAVLGPDFPVEMLLHADDLEILAMKREGRIAAVLAFVAMAAVGAPFKWSKQRGGFTTEWVGITVNYPSYEMGLSTRRAAWIAGWIGELRARKEVSYREFAAGLGRLGFASLALPWERPFLGPLYAWAAAIQGCRGLMSIPWAVLFILGWIKGKFESGLHMEKVRRQNPVEVPGWRIWTDAKADEHRAWIGGWLDTGGGTAEAEWFSVEVDEVMAPWLKCRQGNPKRVIAALEMLATLVAVKLWCKDRDKKVQVLTEAFTDNKGNEFILKKGMSTKYPLTLLVMELCETMKAADLSVELKWVKRDDNQAADDLTNEIFEKFKPELRRPIKSKDIQWIVLDKLMAESGLLYEEIRKAKEVRSQSKKVLDRKKKGKFFGRWAS